jgi:hypothetical protein
MQFKHGHILDVPFYKYLFPYIFIFAVLKWCWEFSCIHSRRRYPNVYFSLASCYTDNRLQYPVNHKLSWLLANMSWSLIALQIPRPASYGFDDEWLFPFKDITNIPANGASGSNSTEKWYCDITRLERCQLTNIQAELFQARSKSLGIISF